MRRLVIGAFVLTACASPASQPAAPAASIIESVPETPTPDTATGATPTSPESAIDPDAVLPDGYALVTARVTEPDGDVCELCLWLADDGDERRTGLMHVTDLGPADGMAFLYPAPHTGRFHMTNTILPLSIAFFAPDGSYIDAFDMEPCERTPCLRYPTPSRFTIAVETLQGGLDALGMVPGSVIELLDGPCAAG